MDEAPMQDSWTAAALSGINLGAQGTQVLHELRRNTRTSAQLLAHELLRLHGITTVPISVESIAQLEGAEVRTEYLPFSDGSLERTVDTYIIRVSSSIAPCRQRFALAHEIGHMLLHRIYQQLTIQEIPLPSVFAGVRSNGKPTEELFCSWFASRLLIPKAVSDEITDWRSLSIERLYSKAQELGVCLDALLFHYLEELQPKGGALRFRIRSKSSPRGLPTSSSDFELVLTQALFPKRSEWIDVRSGIVVPDSDEIYQAASFFYPRVRRRDYVPELLYPEMDLEFGGVKLHRAVLLKPIDQSVWVLVLPEGFDVDELPIKRAIHLQCDRPVQLYLFGQEEVGKGITCVPERTSGISVVKPVQLSFDQHLDV